MEEDEAVCNAVFEGCEGRRADCADESGTVETVRPGYINGPTA